MKKSKLITVLLLSTILSGCSKSDISTSLSPTQDASILSIEDSTLPLEEDQHLFSTTNDSELEYSEISIAFPNDVDNCSDGSFSLLSAQDDTLYFTYLGANSDTQYYMSYDQAQSTWDTITSTSLNYDGFLSDCYNDSIILGTGYWDENDNFNYTITQYTKDSENILYSSLTTGYPSAYIANDYIILNESIPNDDESMTSRLISLDINSKEVQEISSDTYTSTEDLHLTGTITIASGGYNDGICFETVKLDNELTSESDSGSCTIYYYNFSNRSIKKLTDFPDKLIYICGSDDFFISSNYSIVPEEKVEKLVIKDNSSYKYFTIPSILTGNEISNCIKLSDTVYFATTSFTYLIINSANNTYYEGPQKELGNQQNERYGWVQNDDGFCCISKNENSIQLYNYKLSN